MPIAGAVVAGLFLWWLLGSAAPIESDGVAAAGSTTTPSVETTSTTVTAATSAPRTPRRLVMLDVPLSETVPGFTDTIVMLTTPEDSFTIIRWRPSKPMTEVALSLDRDEAFEWFSSWPFGLDASGDWFAQVRDGRALTVHRVPDAVGERSESETVGLHVGSVVWHDTEPGLLAWVECPRSSSGPAVLFTVDVADRSVDPVPLRSFEEGCAGGNVWLEEWTRRGVQIVSEGEGGSADRILIDADGTEIPLGFDSLMLAEGPEGTTLWTEYGPAESSDTSFLLSPDGQDRSAVPGLADDELLSNALWSPDGTHLALNLSAGFDSPNSVLRIVHPVTGAVLMESEVPGFEVVAMT